jgi:hypothetical protein
VAERWEYRVEHIVAARNSKLVEALNEFGAASWEAYFVLKESGGFTVFLKRRAEG